MRVIRHEVDLDSRSEVIRLYPIGDIHIGAAACDEDRLVRMVHRVKADPTARWIGMGDYGDYINVRDKRFNPRTLAAWLKPSDFADLAKAQSDRILSILRPIAPQCWGLVEGNHEDDLKNHSEHDVYSALVSGLREAAGPNPPDLRLGYTGWVQLIFRRSKAETRKGGTSVFNIALHHGFGGGKLAGGKALNMQRWLLSQECDLGLMGHVHDSPIQHVTTLGLDRSGKLVRRKRYGAYTGTYLRGENEDGEATYSERKGYMPMSISHVEVILRPGADGYDDRVQVLTGSLA